MRTHDFLLVRRSRRLRTALWAIGCLLAAWAIASAVVAAVDRYRDAHENPYIFIKT